MSYNSFDYVNSKDMYGCDDFDYESNMEQVLYTVVDGSVEHNIIKEKNESMADLYREISDIPEVWKYISSTVHDQGEKLEIVDEKIKQSGIETSEGMEQLVKAEVLVKNKMTIIRNVALVVGSGVLLTLGGFLIGGPIVGIGAGITGLVGGGAAAAGISKLSK